MRAPGDLPSSRHIAELEAQDWERDGELFAYASTIMCMENQGPQDRRRVDRQRGAQAGERGGKRRSSATRSSSAARSTCACCATASCSGSASCIDAVWASIVLVSFLSYHPRTKGAPVESDLQLTGVDARVAMLLESYGKLELVGGTSCKRKSARTWLQAVEQARERREMERSKLLVQLRKVDEEDDDDAEVAHRRLMMLQVLENGRYRRPPRRGSM